MWDVVGNPGDGFSHNEAKIRCFVVVVGKADLSLRWAHLSFEPRHEKTNVLVSDLVRHRQGCTATEDG